MKKEWLLFIASGAVTLGIALGLIRWLAPGLLGVPTDLQLVQVDKKVPPYFDNVFRESDRSTIDYILPDPITKTRIRPFIKEHEGKGPTDMLGFRNRSIPNVADIITIGDSQTFGNHVVMDFNWPSITRRTLARKKASLYNMSVSGWGPIQYFYITQYALLFRPRLIVVAFYTGNDPLDSFILAYGSELHARFRTDPDLTEEDAPAIVFPEPQEKRWPVRFQDGISTIFTPSIRLASNSNHPAVKAGYDIMAKISWEINDLAQSKDIPVFFTIIPTKELVYALKVEREKLDAPSDYHLLVQSEKRNIHSLAADILKLDGANYIDVLTPLQISALDNIQLYPDTANGHPVYEGHILIGKIISKHINSLLPNPIQGLFYINHQTDDKQHKLMLAKDNLFWLVPSDKIAASNGWDMRNTYPFYTERDLANYEFAGVLEVTDPIRFGPSAIR